MAYRKLSIFIRRNGLPGESPVNKEVLSNLLKDDDNINDYLFDLEVEFNSGYSDEGETFIHVEVYPYDSYEEELCMEVVKGLFAKERLQAVYFLPTEPSTELF